MMYRRGSFQVPVSQGKASTCAEKGHSALDLKGRCLCCGEPPRPVGKGLRPVGKVVVDGQVVGVVTNVDADARTITVHNVTEE